jgi:hypothetical protein
MSEMYMFDGVFQRAGKWYANPTAQLWKGPGHIPEWIIIEQEELDNIPWELAHTDHLMIGKEVRFTFPETFVSPRFPDMDDVYVTPLEDVTEDGTD